jgi:hypothetical protein
VARVGLKVAEARNDILEAITPHGFRFSYRSLADLVSDWPVEVAILASRASLADWLSAVSLAGDQLRQRDLAWAMRCIEAVPASPLPGRLGLTADLATALLLQRLGVRASVPARVPSWTAPQTSLIAFGQFAADVSPLSVPLLSGARFFSAAMSAKLLQAVCLAVQLQHRLVASQMLRWLPSFKSLHQQQRCAYGELLHYVSAVDDAPVIRFNLALSGASWLRRHSRAP